MTTSTHDAPDASARATTPPPPPDAPRALTPPATPSALARASSRPSAHTPPVVVQAIDRIGDIVGVLVVYLLAHEGKLGGIEAVVAIGAILGVGTGLRHVAGRGTTAAAAGAGVGLGALGLLLWHAPTVLPELAARLALVARAVGLAALAAVVLVVTGCASAGGATATLGKVHAWWNVICDEGNAAFVVAEHAARTAEGADGGAGDASAPPAADAGAPAADVGAVE